LYVRVHVHGHGIRCVLDVAAREGREHMEEPDGQHRRRRPPEPPPPPSCAPVRSGPRKKIRWQFGT
jgi:hypothetical protein